MADAVSAAAYSRRSFLYRHLQAAGANFVEIAGGAMANDYGAPETEVETAKRMAIADLSVLPRTGFKGAGTVEWMASEGLKAPADSNRATAQKDGSLAARLAPSEIFLLGDLDGKGKLVGKLQQAWNDAPRPPKTPRGFPMPRQETHAWFIVTGSEAARMFAKVCGVDLRPDRFENGQIAQTSVARANGVIVRGDQGDTLAYHLLVDSASADFFWPAILDAMAEFGGTPVGHSAIRALSGK